MHIGTYLQLVHKSEQDLVKAFTSVAIEHGDEPDIKENCKLLASWSGELAQLIKQFAEKYQEEDDNEPDRLVQTLFKNPRTGSLAMLRDLHDLWLMTQEASLCCILLRQAATGLHDKELIEVCNKTEQQSKRQAAWLLTRMKSAAPQTLIAAQ